MNTKVHSPNYPERFLVKESSSKRFPSLKFRRRFEITIKKFTEIEKTRLVVEGQSCNMSISEFCKRNDIELKEFDSWCKEYLLNKIDLGQDTAPEVLANEELKRSIINEGRSGISSVAEICRRENITQDTFLEWCEDLLLESNRDWILRKLNNPIYKNNLSLLSRFLSRKAVGYIENYIDLNDVKTQVKLDFKDDFLDKNECNKAIISLQRLNDVRYINKYLELINSKLKDGGVFIGCMETFSERKNALRISKIPVINNLYFSFEFLFKRILPKVSFTKQYYFDFTKGQDRLMSKAEGLGRLVSCGFRIIDFKSFNGKLYFVVKKIKEPYFDLNPSYGPLYKMPRLGKNGKIIGVYKFRTMHPYSEYLQDYIVKAHGYAETGKPANDFRIPNWGKFMRRFWLDEIPQLFNVIKGELKLVGVRPVSQRYFDDIPKEMQKLRNTQKPGCIPPYVALNREGNVMSVLQSEKDYLIEKIKNPYFTDIKYFFNAIFNIVIRHKRSA